MRALKLWILDADVIIDLLSFEVFNNLTKHCELHLSSTVIGEVQFYKKGQVKIPVDFRKEYVETGEVKEVSATSGDLEQVLDLLPASYKQGIGAGELESLAVLNNNRELIFCSIDGLAIKSLPFIDMAENGISVEELLRQSGVAVNGLKKSHTDAYFKTKLAEGQQDKIYLS